MRRTGTLAARSPRALADVRPGAPHVLSCRSRLSGTAQRQWHNSSRWTSGSAVADPRQTAEKCSKYGAVHYRACQERGEFGPRKTRLNRASKRLECPQPRGPGEYSGEEEHAGPDVASADQADQEERHTNGASDAGSSPTPSQYHAEEHAHCPADLVEPTTWGSASRGTQRGTSVSRLASTPG